MGEQRLRRNSLVGESLDSALARLTAFPRGFALVGVAGVMALVSAGLYLTWPLPEDNGLHFAGIHQALVSGRGILEVWNFRAPVYNAYLLLLYRFATLWVEFFDGRFDVIVRSVHFAVILGGCAVWARGIGSRFSLPERETLVIGAITLFAMTSGWRTIPLHAEDVAMTAMLYGVGLAMLPNGGAQVGAAIIAGGLPLVKGITALYALPIFLACLGTSGWRRVGRLVLIAGGTVALSVALIWLVAPVQITDLLETLRYQGGKWSVTARLERSSRSVTYVVRNPLLLPGLVAFALHVGALIRDAEWRELGFLCVLWGVPVLCLLLQGQYYIYHLAPISLAAAYSVAFLLLKADRQSDVRANPRLATLLVSGGIVALGAAALQASELAPPSIVVTSTAFLALAVLLNGRVRSSHVVALLLMAGATIWFRAQGGTSPNGIVGTRNWAWAYADDFRTQLGERVERRVGAGNTILLAAYGVAARYTNVKSACRHFFAVPIQRNWGSRHFEELAGYQEAHRCFENYQGKYVLWETNWFKKPQLKQTSILKRYKVVDRFRVRKREYALLERRGRRP